MSRAQRNRRSIAAVPAQPVRCAVYCRKSTDENLDTAFNSLDAQREACLAYITSQKHEGWIAHQETFEDGGFSGGNMDRPALNRLLADIKAGKIQCVVIYKLDRLSRSMLDFLRILKFFEENKVAFVSVTQQFNTSTSVGRVTMNILLSFAQFEREMIADRTRDKMQAARRKGKWTGGMPPLGFDVPPEGVLVTGFCAGPKGATLDIVGTFERTAAKMVTVVDVCGTPVEVQLTYLGPLPGEKTNGRPAPCGNER